MGWFKWKRATTSAVPEPAPEPVAPVESDAAVIARLRAVWAAAGAAREAARQAAEAAAEEGDRQRAERERQRMLAIIARQGAFFPGDVLDDPRTPARETWEGEGGVRWFRL